MENYRVSHERLVEADRNRHRPATFPALASHPSQPFMFPDRQPILEIERLRLRPFARSDAVGVRLLTGAREVADTALPVPHPHSDGAADMWITGHREQWVASRSGAFAVTSGATGALLGTVSLTVTPAHSSAELGYWIAIQQWGNGVAMEAAGALCAYAVGVLRIHRIQARHFVRNPASRRVVRKLCMRQEGVLRDAVCQRAQFESVALYGVLAPGRHAAASPNSAVHVQYRVAGVRSCTIGTRTWCGECRCVSRCEGAAVSAHRPWRLRPLVAHA